MTLIRSISGIRGTIGGQPGESLTPYDIVRSTAAFATFLKKNRKGRKVVVGRDARISGSMVRNMVVGTLQGCGLDVVDLGLSTTPTVEMAVPKEQAIGGIILTASHNPKEWNALKLLNDKGEFISDQDGKEVLELADHGTLEFVEVDDLGEVTEGKGYDAYHFQRILDLDLVDIDSIRSMDLKIVVDGVNSSGGVFVPALLKELGVNRVVELNCEPTGLFAHNPEPLPEHLEELANTVREEGADLGIVVDPDVDRLAFVDENGEMFGEEYTLVAVADHVLSKRSGNTVSNLSSSRALRDVTEKLGGTYYASAVGEVNVVKKMKEVDAVIGGEGNGGVILPDLHFGRDALVGIGLFLSLLAERRIPCSELRRTYPDYFMTKSKISLEQGVDLDRILDLLASEYGDHPQDRQDGLKIEFDSEWVHLRRSNTEPLIRVYAESKSKERAEELADEFVQTIQARTG